MKHTKKISLIAKLVSRVRQSSVEFPLPTVDILNSMSTWCEENVGMNRGHHPLLEAEKGFIDFYEGTWAYNIFTDDYQSLIASFWFEYEDDMAMFALTFGNYLK